MSDKVYDAVVIGSGAGGSFAVKELTAHGLDVLLLEAGQNVTEADFKNLPPDRHAKGIGIGPRFKAALRGQYVQARYMSFSERFSKYFVNDRENPYTHPLKNYFLWIRGRQLGGRLHTFGRVVLRMSDWDFKAASLDGFGDDWPISYADIAPYYDKVEDFLGVYGSQENIPNLPDGKYSMTPSLTRLEKDFKFKVEAAWPERHVIPWRYLSPNLNRVPLPVLKALETGRLSIRTQSVVKRIIIDPATGKAAGVIYVDRATKKEGTVSANLIVLCASTIESIRLMLNSACSRYPSGLGNSSGLLGHYFMDHCPAVMYGSIPGSSGWEYDKSVPQDPAYAPAGGIYIPRFHNMNGIINQNFVRGMAFQGTIGGIYVPDESPSAFGIMGFGEMLPYYNNCVTVNNQKKDAWGIPVANIKCLFTRNEIEVMKEQLRILKEMAGLCKFKIEMAGNAMGLDKNVDVFPNTDWLSRYIFRMSFRRSLSAGAAIHEVGGVRMGDDPSKSILNPFNQCWDIKNLFVTDGSCFVSNGMAGPALTIMALTVRACEYAVKEYKKGTL